MLIRLAAESDSPFIVDIYNSTIPSGTVTADTSPVSVESRIGWFCEHNPHNRPIWVAQDDDIIVGWLSLSTFYNRPAYNSTVEVSIYIAQEYRRKGIGNKLLSKAILESPSLGITTILAFVFGHNKPSLQFFKQFNFERWGSLPKVAVLDGKERDLFILGLRVKP